MTKQIICCQCGEVRTLDVSSTTNPSPEISLRPCRDCEAQNRHDHDVDMAGGHTALRLERERQQMLDAGFPEWMC